MSRTTAVLAAAILVLTCFQPSAGQAVSGGCIWNPPAIAAGGPLPRSFFEAKVLYNVVGALYNEGISCLDYGFDYHDNNDPRLIAAKCYDFGDLRSLRAEIDNKEPATTWTDGLPDPSTEWPIGLIDEFYREMFRHECLESIIGDIKFLSLKNKMHLIPELQQRLDPLETRIQRYNRYLQQKHYTLAMLYSKISHFQSEDETMTKNMMNMEKAVENDQLSFLDTYFTNLQSALKPFSWKTADGSCELACVRGDNVDNPKTNSGSFGKIVVKNGAEMTEKEAFNYSFRIGHDLKCMDRMECEVSSRLQETNVREVKQNYLALTSRTVCEDPQLAKMFPQYANSFYGRMFFHCLPFDGLEIQVYTPVECPEEKTTELMDVLEEVFLKTAGEFANTAGSPGAEVAAETIPDGEYFLTLQPLDPTDLAVSTAESPNRCRLVCTLVDQDNKPVSGAEIRIGEPGLGTVSGIILTTDSEGRAEVVYTAPTAEELEEAGKVETELYITATDLESGANEMVMLRVKAGEGISFKVKTQVVPGHPGFYNPLQLILRATDTFDGSSDCRAVLRTSSTNGRLVKIRNTEGGEDSLAVTLVPNRPHHVYYHWTGPPPAGSALEETVTVEVPKFGIEASVSFSVGMDLRIASVESRHPGAPLLPCVFEQLHVAVEDAFHPDADLAALVAEYPALRPTVRIEEAEFEPREVSASESGYLNALLGSVEAQDKTGWAGMTSVVLGTFRKEKDKWLVCEQPEKEGGVPGPANIGALCYRRGTYRFQASLEHGEFDPEPENNRFITGSYTLEHFSSMGQELFHTAALPITEKFLRMIISYSGGMPAEIGLAAADVYSAPPEEKVKKLISSTVGVCFSKLEGLVRIDPDKLSHITARVLMMNELGSTTQDMVEETLSRLEESPEAEISRRVTDALKDPPKTKKGVFGRISAVLEEVTKEPSPAGQDEEKVAKGMQEMLEASQCMLQGSGKHYLVVFRNRASEYEVLDGEGNRLMPAGGEELSDDLNRRIHAGEKIVVIPAENSEKLILDMTRARSMGEIIIVTSDGIRHNAWPRDKESARIEVEPGGRLSFK